MRRDKANHCFAAGSGQLKRIQIINELAEQKNTDKPSKLKLCDLFGVRRSSYYNNLADKPINEALIELKAIARQVFEQSGRSAGARTISNIVTKQHGIKLTRYKASKLMKQMGLISRQYKRHSYKLADKPHHTHDNVLDRQFSPSASNQVWTGDVTYIRIKGGWCYLAIVMDLYARRIVGFTMSESPNTDLTQSALNMAYAVRMKPTDILFHSDQGTHYTSEEFAKAVCNCGKMTHSMSKRGNPLRTQFSVLHFGQRSARPLLSLVHRIMLPLKVSSVV